MKCNHYLEAQIIQYGTKVTLHSIPYKLPVASKGLLEDNLIPQSIKANNLS